MNATHYRSLFILPAMICVLGTASLLAQTDTSVDAVSATSEATPSEAPNMPDISGVWQIRSWSPQSAGKIDEIEIRRTENSSEEFEPSLTHVPKGLPIPRIHWLVGTRKFEWNWKNPSIPDGGMKAAMQVAGDDQSIRVTIEVDETTTKLYAEQGMTEAQIDELLNQVWTRKPMDVAQSASAADTKENSDRTNDPNMPDITGRWLWVSNDFRKVFITRITDEPKSVFRFHSEGGPQVEFTWLPGEGVFAVTVDPPDPAILGYFAIVDRNITIYPFKSEDERKSKLSKIRVNNFEQPLPTQTFSRPYYYLNVQGKGIIISEADEGLSGYSEALGTWDKIQVSLPKDGFPRLLDHKVGFDVALAVVDHEIFAFGGQTGKWSRFAFPPEAAGKIKSTVGQGFLFASFGNQLAGFSSRANKIDVLTIPEEFVGKVNPTMGLNNLTAQVGPKLYVFSPKTGEWTSADGVTEHPDDEFVPIKRKLPQLQREGNGLFSPPKSRVPLAMDSNEFQQLTARIQQHEAQAAELARSFASASDETAARKQIETELAAALDLKFQREELQVKELQFRLSKLEQQIGRRKALREQIIERRAQELLNHKETQWEDETETARERQEVGGNLQRAARTIPVNPLLTHRYNNLATPESSVPVQKLDHNIVIDLYAGDGIYARKSKLHGKSIGDIVKPLKKLPDVIVNIRIAGEGDQFVMATIRDQSQRCQRDTNLRASILTVLKEAEIKTIRWEEFVEERGSSAGNSLPEDAEDVEYPDTP